MRQEGNQQERPELSWLAGIAEGEGSFYSSKHDHGKEGVFYYPCFCIVNTDLRLLDKVCEILKVNNIGYYMQPHRVRGKVLAYTVRVNGMKRLSKFIPLILPYMNGYKREQALDVLKYIEWRLTQPLHHLDKEPGRLLKEKLTKLNSAGILRDYTPTHFHLVEDIVPSA